jgi:hypothetical protein
MDKRMAKAVIRGQEPVYDSSDSGDDPLLPTRPPQHMYPRPGGCSDTKPLNHEQEATQPSGQNSLGSEYNLGISRGNRQETTQFSRQIPVFNEPQLGMGHGDIGAEVEDTPIADVELPNSALQALQGQGPANQQLGLRGNDALHHRALIDRDAVGIVEFGMVVHWLIYV